MDARTARGNTYAGVYVGRMHGVGPCPTPQERVIPILGRKGDDGRPWKKGEGRGGRPAHSGVPVISWPVKKDVCIVHYKLVRRDGRLVGKQAISQTGHHASHCRAVQ